MATIERKCQLLKEMLKIHLAIKFDRRQYPALSSRLDKPQSRDEKLALHLGLQKGRRISMWDFFAIIKILDIVIVYILSFRFASR